MFLGGRSVTRGTGFFGLVLLLLFGTRTGTAHTHTAWEDVTKLPRRKNEEDEVRN